LRAPPCGPGNFRCPPRLSRIEAAEMLGGLKAALGGSRRGPVLQSSGSYVVHPDLRSPTSSEGSTQRRVGGPAFDEDAPDQLSNFPRHETPKGPKSSCKLGGAFLDDEAGARLSTASTYAPPTSAGFASPPTTAGTVSLDCGGLAWNTGGASSEARLGLTQLVISLDLDIMGPQGLLAQLGLPAQHEVETGLLRVQCNGMQVHHRPPDSARSHHPGTAGNHAVGLLGEQSSSPQAPSSPLSSSNSACTTARAPADPAKAAGLSAAPQQFYIGDHTTKACGPDATSSGNNILPDDFSHLFARDPKGRAPVKDDPPNSAWSSNGDSDYCHMSHAKHGPCCSDELMASTTTLPGSTMCSGSRSCSSSGTSGGSSGGQLRSSASPKDVVGHTLHTPLQPTRSSSGTIQSGIPSISGLSSRSTGRRPSTQESLSGKKAQELQELEELRKKNMRLERDLYESLQALEEESVISSSSSSSNDSPLPSPAPGRCTRRLKDLGSSASEGSSRPASPASFRGDTVLNVCSDHEATVAGGFGSSAVAGGSG